MKTTLFILIFFISFASQAQESNNSSGGVANGTGGSVSFSVGQTFTTTYSGPSGTISEGVQQAYEIFTSFETEESKNLDILLRFFPNPTNDKLTLQLNNLQYNNLNYQIVDGSGKIIMNQLITSNEINIEMSALAPSIYFLKILMADKEIKIFKIIKN